MTAILFALLVATAPGQTPPDLRALDFLLGDWEAVDLPPGESGAFVFSAAVQERIIVRTSYAKYPARDGQPAMRHDDLMVIFSEDHALKADYFDSEQHVIRYTIQPRGPRDVVFISDPKPSQPRYRLTYTLGANGMLKGSFEIAPPGEPDTFKPYLAWTARKLK
jgi:hypothetical protein